MTAPPDLGLANFELPEGGKGKLRIEVAAEQTERPVVTDALIAPAEAPSGKTPADWLADLHRRLAVEPWSFAFTAAVRRMENAAPHLPRVGHSMRLSEEMVRFSQDPSLAFAPATVTEFNLPPEGETGRPTMTVRFMGLCGPNGAMPLHVTEWVRERIMHHKDRTPARFFDLFNNRMIALFYRAWALNQQAVSFERGADQRARAATAASSRRAEPDRIAVYIASLFGQGMASMRERDAAPDLAKLHYAGWLSNHVKNADGLEALIADLMGVPCHVETFVGQWVKLPAESHCRLGGPRSATEMGVSTIVGSSIWNVQQAFRIRMGPMTFEQYQRFLPGKWSLKKLTAIVRNYIGDELDWSVKLVLKANEVPRVKLGALGQVGWSTWLGSKPFESDVEDLELRPNAA